MWFYYLQAARWSIQYGLHRVLKNSCCYSFGFRRINIFALPSKRFYKGITKACSTPNRSSRLRASYTFQGYGTVRIAEGACQV